VSDESHTAGTDTCCVVCAEPFITGQQIVRVGDGWRHEGCTDSPERRERQWTLRWSDGSRVPAVAIVTGPDTRGEVVEVVPAAALEAAEAERDRLEGLLYDEAHHRANAALEREQAEERLAEALAEIERLKVAPR
jgi:hypothetical protein